MTNKIVRCLNSVIQTQDLIKKEDILNFVLYTNSLKKFYRKIRHTHFWIFFFSFVSILMVVLCILHIPLPFIIAENCEQKTQILFSYHILRLFCYIQIVSGLIGPIES